jgi:PPK2 family polyphosphate:nucleotide phosphotransferase
LSLARAGHYIFTIAKTTSGREARMNYTKQFIVEPGAKLRLGKIDPAYSGKHKSRETAAKATATQVARMDQLQYLLYADGSRSLLIVLQGLDAAGKDGTVRHLFAGMNPQGTSVASFKEPTKEELAHDFLWRVHSRAPAKGEVVIFNRSHYEDVLVVRVHKTVPRSVWSKRYDQINSFEKLLHENGTCILKFFLHISADEQLERFRQRLEDPERRWKISDSDYSERKLWPKYMAAYEEAIAETSTKQAPWYVIPSNHKWFRNLAISQIVADAMDGMGLKLPPARVDIAAIRRKYYAAKRAAGGKGS